MKMHAKEIIKNKADKMVDLIIDEIGPEGQKRLSASFIDKKTNIKYIIKLGIESGSPDSLVEQIDEEDIPSKVEDLIARVITLEAKQDNDTIYDDSTLSARVDALEAKEDYDDSGIKARLTVLENKTDNDTVYDDTELRERITALEQAAEGDDNS